MCTHTPTPAVRQNNTRASQHQGPEFDSLTWVTFLCELYIFSPPVLHGFPPGLPVPYHTPLLAPGHRGVQLHRLHTLHLRH